MNAVYNDQPFIDDFHVRITATNPSSKHLPALYEVGGRTEAIAAKWGFSDLRTLHRNKGGHACVCVAQMEKRKFPPGSDLFLFIEELAVPYLYGLAYYEKHRKWPWGDFAHGALGLLEFYALDSALQTEAEILKIIPSLCIEPNWRDYRKQLLKPSAKRECLCGSTKPFRNCHNTAWKGLVRLQSEILRLNLPLDLQALLALTKKPQDNGPAS